MHEPIELRPHVARALHGRAKAITRDAVELFQPAKLEKLAGPECAPLTSLILQLMIAAVREGTIDSRHVAVADLRRLASENSVGLRALFSVVSFVQQSGLDALALDPSIGVASEPWPVLTQIVHRASLDVYAALAEAGSGGVVETGVTDPLTTLHTRAVFVAVLEKEIQRSDRFGRTFAMILLDIDHLADINARHGYGAGDRVLERVGIVVKSHFRNTDFVARLGEDTFAVLLPEIQCVDAERLAERMRVAVQERLPLHDHRSEQRFPVTISVAILVADSLDRNVSAESLLAHALAAMERAKKAGGNRVERAEDIVPATSVPMRAIAPIDQT